LATGTRALVGGAHDPISFWSILSRERDCETLITVAHERRPAQRGLPLPNAGRRLRDSNHTSIPDLMTLTEHAPRRMTIRFSARKFMWPSILVKPLLRIEQGELKHSA
jgi:hypothetical protein